MKDFCTRIQGACPHSRKNKEFCFIMMAYDEFYSKEIEEMLKWSISTEATPKLAKDFRTKGSVDMFCVTVCKPIKESRFCIADVTYDNTSVGYEWALAEKFDKPVIATLYQPKIKSFNDSEKISRDKLIQKGVIRYPAIRKDFPGDFRALLTIKYKNRDILKKNLEKNFNVREA
jgi:hypothetical protein